MVLDEATSALDLKTEEKVINMLGKLAGSMTIIMISHRMETLKKCDHVYKVSKNGLEEVDMKRLFKDEVK